MIYRKTRCSIILLNVLCLFFSSCLKELAPDLSGVKPKIVMHGILSPDSLIEVSISRSYSYLSSGQSPVMSQDVSLKLFVNGEFRETMQRRPDRQNTNGEGSAVTPYRATLHPRIGDKIRIEASAEGFETVWAETTVPVPLTIEKVDTTTFFTQYQGEYYYSGYDGYWYYPYPVSVADSITIEPFLRNLRLKVKIKSGDTSTPQNFYFEISRRQITSDTTVFHETMLFPNTGDDPIFAKNPKNSILDDLFGIDYSTSPFFTNRLFSNNTYTLNVSVSDYYVTNMVFEKYDGQTNPKGNGYKLVGGEVLNPPIEVRVLSVSPELSPYYSDEGMGGYSGDSSINISEPYVTYTNVHNGIGIVGAVSVAKKEIKIPPFPGGRNVFPPRW